jgi:hypothetical protein
MSPLTESDKYYFGNTDSTSKSKTFESALDVFFAREFPQVGGELVRPLIVNEIKKRVEQYYPLTSRMKMGQVMWVGVAKEEKQSYGKKLENTKLKPVVLDLCTTEDLEALFQKKKNREIKKELVARLYRQAFEQGACLTGTDVAALMKMSASTISKYAREYEKENDCLLPRRGTIHDIGRSITHKAVICRKVILEKKTIEETARETNHSVEAVSRYITNFKRIYKCLEKGLSINDTSFAIKVSKNLIMEYVSLIDDLKKKNDDFDFDDIPF